MDSGQPLRPKPRGCLRRLRRKWRGNGGKAKELKDLAITAGDWARRNDAGEEAIRFCRRYALEAEKRIGELLLATEWAKGAKGNPGGRGAKLVQLPDDTAQPNPSLCRDHQEGTGSRWTAPPGGTADASLTAGWVKIG